MQVGRNHKFLVLGAALLCLVIAFVVVQRVRAGGPSHTHNGRDVMPAAIALVKRAPIGNTFSVAGEFDPYQEVELHAKVAGYIHKIYVDIGDRVKTGQVLAVLEVPELTAQLQGAGAGVRHSQQEINARKMKSRAMRPSTRLSMPIPATETGIGSAARPDRGAGTRRRQAKDRAAEAQVDAAKSALSATQQQLGVSQADQQHYSALADYSRITAPFDGVVTWRYADTGSLIQAGTSNVSSMPVVKLAQVNVLRLRIPVPESLGGQSYEMGIPPTSMCRRPESTLPGK